MATLVETSINNYQPHDVDPEEDFTDDECDDDVMFVHIKDPDYAKYLSRLQMLGVKMIYEEDPQTDLPWYKKLYSTMFVDETIPKGKLYIFATQRSIIDMTKSPYFEKKFVPELIKSFNVNKIAFMPMD